MPARHFLSSDRSNSLTPAKNSHFILRGSSRISADLASEGRKDGRDVSRARVNLQRRDLVGDRHDVDRRRCNSRESRSATGQEGRPRGRLESGTKRKREEEGAARCRHLDSRRLNATVPPDSTCRTKKLEREKTLFPRMPLCSSKTFQIVGRISLFLAPLPRGKQNYIINYSSLSSFENGPRLIRGDVFVLLFLLLLLFSLCSLYAQRSLSRRQVSR